jgi:predicted metal-dependent hydrolase
MTPVAQPSSFPPQKGDGSGSNVPPEEFWLGVEQFNQQEYYACHDTLEALWIEAGEPQKRFYQGVLQIAVACHHLLNLNWRGAVILLGEGLGRLRDYQPDYEGIDVTGLMMQSAELLQALQQSGQEQVTDFVKHLQAEPTGGVNPVSEESSRRLPKIGRVES